MRKHLLLATMLLLMSFCLVSCKNSPANQGETTGETAATEIRIETETPAEEAETKTNDLEEQKNENTVPTETIAEAEYNQEKADTNQNATNGSGSVQQDTKESAELEQWRNENNVTPDDEF